MKFSDLCLHQGYDFVIVSLSPTFIQLIIQTVFFFICLLCDSFACMIVVLTMYLALCLTSFLSLQFLFALELEF